MAQAVIGPVSRWHDSGIVGVGPGLWYGPTALNGAAGDWKRAPLGSIYVRVDASGTATAVWQKIDGAGATADWKRIAFHEAVALIQSIIRPPSDSATALQIQNAAGTVSLITFDTTTPKINTAASLSVTGTASQNIAEWKDSTGSMQALVNSAGQLVTSGIAWTTRTSAADNDWYGICYGNGLYVAVASTGTGNRVMTSPDGVVWTARTSASNNDWRSVCYGNGLFVAVAITGSGNRVMTSPDGITWTARTSAADNNWLNVCYGNGLFVAVSATGSGNRVMTSPDGITWTSRTSASDNNWYGVCYGNGLYVAVAYSGTATRVMTSPDGITWTTRTSAADNDWRSVCYGNGLFVTVSITGSGNRVMTSPDGITWTTRTSAADNNWYGVCYGNGLFVAVASTGTGTRVMTSPDGITWTTRTNSAANSWLTVCYGNGSFVAIASSGTATRVMTSGKILTREPLAVRSVAIDQNNTTNATPVLTLRQADVSEEFIRLIGTSAADNSQSLVDAANLTTPGTIAGWVKVYIQDDLGSGPITDGVYFIPFYTTPTA